MPFTVNAIMLRAFDLITKILYLSDSIIQFMLRA
jgi:hypothetical protein